MNRFNNVIIGQKAFITNRNKQLLIIKRDKTDTFSSYWDIPGGKVEETDTLLNGLKREIKEEVNLDLEKIILTLSSSKFQGSFNDKPIIIRNIYLCIASGRVELSEEHLEYKWVDAKDLTNYHFPEDKDIQSIINNLPEILETINLDLSISLVS